MTAKRMQTLRAKRKAQGLVRVEVWAPKGCAGLVTKWVQGKVKAWEYREKHTG